jgi:hypothetical protein
MEDNVTKGENQMFDSLIKFHWKIFNLVLDCLPVFTYLNIIM